MEDMNMELDSFFIKFKQLWRDGLDAHLDLETHAGNACVGLILNLGHHPSRLISEFQVKRSSPSRICRQEKRALKQKPVDRNDYEENTNVFEQHDENETGEDTGLAAQQDVNVVTEEVANKKDLEVDPKNFNKIGFFKPPFVNFR